MTLMMCPMLLTLSQTATINSVLYFSATNLTHDAAAGNYTITTHT